MKTNKSNKDYKSNDTIRDKSKDKDKRSQSPGLKSSIDKIEASYYDNVNLNKDFNGFLSKFKYLSDEDKDVVIRKINVYAIFAENKIQLLKKIFTCKENFFYFNFYNKGKPKEVISKREKKEFNFFEALHYSYKKFNKTRGVEEAFLDFSDILYDMTGLPMVEWDLRNKMIINKIISDLKILVHNDYSILILLNDEEEDKMQCAYQILNYHEFKEKIELNKYKLEEVKSFQSRYLTEKNQQEYLTNSLEKIEAENIFFKVRKLKRTDSLKTLYDFNSLINSKEDIDKIRELYPDGDIYYSFISIGELCQKKLFNRLLILEFKKFELQLNGKFVKCIREKDNIIEYKSRWNYTFNVTTDNFDVTIGIHQNTFNSAILVSNHLYIGLIVLKSSYPMLFFVDYLPLKEARQNFFNLKLEKGTYVVVPITSGYYFSLSNENLIDIENIPIIEVKVDQKTKNNQSEFSNEARNIVDEIFDKFDINRDGQIGLDELKMFYEYAVKEKYSARKKIPSNDGDNNNEVKTVFKNFLDSNNEINLKDFRKFFFFLEQNHIKVVDIFRKFGYNYYSSNECRHFFLSFHSNEKIDVRISDGNNNRYTSYAFELYLRHVGTVVQIKDNNNVNLICDNTRDSCNIMLMLENKSDTARDVTLEIGCNGYVSHNGFTYKSELKGKEIRYLFAIAIDKEYLKNNPDKDYRIKYEISCV